MAGPLTPRPKLCRLDEYVNQILYLDTVDLLEISNQLANLRDIAPTGDLQNVKIICRMGGANRRCGGCDEDDESCAACNMRSLSIHPRFISDKDYDSNNEFCELVFGPARYIPPGITQFAIVEDDDKRAYVCPTCGDRLPDTVRADLWHHKGEVVTWFNDHARCVPMIKSARKV